ncbi:hypothetical protein LR48_Vigan03g107800 [Vigna angularis]|uniref:Uncharacterized protein n=1 Tax=Phaseolus angularis TaxID=3914 RepID=A0A0L9U4J1_PHAAN|nr:hypothetical protein LR48_Vigan03g107800 [Vigna angularis]
MLEPVNWLEFLCISVWSILILRKWVCENESLELGVKSGVGLFGMMKVPSSERKASPSGWISDITARERFMGWKSVKDVAPHKSIELSLFKNEGFIFPEKLERQGLSTFVQMKGDCYPELVGVFYNNIKVVDGNIHSRVKGVDIIINNDTCLQVTGLKDEGHMSHLPNCLQNRWNNKTKMFKDCMRYPGRYKKEKGFLHRWLDKEEKIIAYIYAEGFIMII